MLHNTPYAVNRPGAILPPDGGFLVPYGTFASGGVSPDGDQRSAALSRRSLDEDGWTASGYDPARYCRLTAAF